MPAGAKATGGIAFLPRGGESFGDRSHDKLGCLPSLEAIFSDHGTLSSERLALSSTSRVRLYAPKQEAPICRRRAMKRAESDELVSSGRGGAGLSFALHSMLTAQG